MSAVIANRAAEAPEHIANTRSVPQGQCPLSHVLAGESQGDADRRIGGIVTETQVFKNAVNAAKLWKLVLTDGEVVVARALSIRVHAPVSTPTW